MKKKKNSFYNNKNRNQKWTEPETGRPIDFADKYIEGDDAYDKYDYKREKKNNEAFRKARKKRNLKRALAAFLSVVILCTGYIIADIHIIRHAAESRFTDSAEDGDGAGLSEMNISVNAFKIQSVSLDNSLMLSSVIEEAVNIGSSAAVFDAKRDDGTIGYASTLAAVDTFGAVSEPAKSLEASISELLSNDILPVARVSCYLDNVAPVSSDGMGVKSGDSLYKDGSGNTYLNPDSEEAYGYIKDIIQECTAQGVEVFVLANCNLPQGISENYNDGFDTLSKKLQKDVSADIKLLEEVDVTISGVDSESGEINAKGVNAGIAALPELGENQIYSISTTIRYSVLKEYLKLAEIERYVIINN